MSSAPLESLALLIDAENISPVHVEEICRLSSQLGRVNVRRIYGDWTRPQMSSWKECLLKHAIQPIQQFAYSVGKNATDTTMIIDAMDLLHSGRYSGICLVSSDSDFTRLAMRIREQGLKIFGMGGRATPQAFMTACDSFYVLGAAAPERSPQPPSLIATQPNSIAMYKEVECAMKLCSSQDGWVSLSTLGHALKKKPKEFGFKRLTDLVAVIPFLERKGTAQQTMVRIRLSKK